MANYNSIYTGPQIDSAVGLGLTSVQPSAIANFETTTELNSRDTANRDRANHTGTQLANTISDFDSAASAAAPVQSSDIANFETTTQLNSRDTANRDRANHTGTQLANTISDFDSAVDARFTPAGANGQIQFNDSDAFGGDTALTWNKTTDELTVGGDVILDDGVAGFETIVQCVPPTADRVISFPDSTGIVALTSDLTSKVSSDPTGVTGADQITNMMSLTQAEYDVITPDSDTFYVIVG